MCVCESRLDGIHTYIHIYTHIYLHKAYPALQLRDEGAAHALGVPREDGGVDGEAGGGGSVDVGDLAHAWFFGGGVLFCMMGVVLRRVC